MDIVPNKIFNKLKPPTPTTKEPPTEEVSVFNLCRMISRRTCFRIADIEEIIREAGYATFAILLERKSVTFGGVSLRSRWHRLDAPRYVRRYDVEDSGYWVFGYYMPEVNFGLQERQMYTSRDGEFSEKFIYDISSYLPTEISDEEAIKEYSKKCMENTSVLGKELCVDEEGYMIYPDGSRKRRKRRFDENFHPTWYEYRRYYFAKFNALRDWNDRKRNGEPDLSYSYVSERMLEYGYNVYEKRIITRSEREKYGLDQDSAGV